METNDVLGTLAILLSVLILIYLVWGNGKTPENLDEQTKRSKKKGRTV